MIVLAYHSVHYYLYLQPFVEIREARHPCVTRTFGGGDFIPNDTVIGIPDVSRSISNLDSIDNNLLHPTQHTINIFFHFYNSIVGLLSNLGVRHGGGR